MTEMQEKWKIAGLAILPIRFVQGWIFWGGGSRRFIYDPTKLDPYAHDWMANKLQSAMPGAILGVNHLISFLLLHFYLLYASILIFSLVELISGLGLIIGCCTRFAAITTMLISIVLMLTFGWQGATCMDEWTMAVATLAMGFTLALSGASVYSIDSLLLRKHPNLTRHSWFIFLASGPPKSLAKFKKIVLIAFVLTVAFTLLTYNYYRGSIFTPYHLGPVSAGPHHISLSNGVLKKDGSILLTLYVDGGTPAVPSNIIRIELLDEKNQIVSQWNSKTLSSLPDSQIQNEYPYIRVHSGPYGLIAPLSSKATLILTPEKSLQLFNKPYQLVIYTINDHQFQMTLNVSEK